MAITDSPRRLSLALTALIALVTVVLVPITASLSSAAGPDEDTVGLVDTSRGVWYLRDTDGDVKWFFYGNPGDMPFMGDWDCDGIDTPGLYRQSDGFVYLRNEISQGIAEGRFFFGNPGDMPVAGDFNADGCDTVSIYRPSEGRFYIINKLGSADEGLGAAEVDYLFGNVGDKPFAGDWDGDGTDTVGLHRESTSLVYIRNSHTEGAADTQFIFGDPGDRFVAGDWDGDGTDGAGLFRPLIRRFFLKNVSAQGAADAEFFFGEFDWEPVAGFFDDLEASPTTSTTIPPDTPFTFGDGSHPVGVDIPAGTYRNTDSSDSCVWQRLDDEGDEIASDVSLDVEIVTIETTDATFESAGCTLWDNALTPRIFPDGPRLTIGDDFGDGTWLVSEEVAFGLWNSDTPLPVCSWELLTGFTGEAGDVAAGASSSVPIQVSIEGLGGAVVGFHSSGCGSWTADT